MLKLLVMICVLVGATLLAHVVYPPTGNTLFSLFGFGFTWAFLFGIVMMWTVHKGMKAQSFKQPLLAIAIQKQWAKDFQEI